MKTYAPNYPFLERRHWIQFEASWKGAQPYTRIGEHIAVNSTINVSELQEGALAGAEIWRGLLTGQILYGRSWREDSMNWSMIDRFGMLIIERWKPFLALFIVALSLYGFLGTIGGSSRRIEGIRVYYGGKVTIESDRITIQKQDWTFVLTPVERYEISGKVVGKKSYPRGDPGHLVSPMDVALAWEELISPEYEADIKYSMGEREYFFTYYPGEGSKKLTAEYITTHSSNNHLIPANEEIRKAVGRLKIGDTVTLSGRLVNIEGRNQKSETFDVKTSRSRSDSGPGSCEIIFLENILVN